MYHGVNKTFLYSVISAGGCVSGPSSFTEHLVSLSQGDDYQSFTLYLSVECRIN